MRRRDFLAAGAVGLPVAGLAAAKAFHLEEEPARRPRPESRARRLKVPANGAVAVGFAIGAHVNVIDVAGPWEVFQDVGAETGGRSPFELFTVAESTEALTATGGLQLVPHHSYDDAPQPSVVVVPAHHATDATRAWLKRAAADADLVMSVCTGAFILAESGLLDGLTATTHHGFHASFASEHSKVKLVRDKRYVEHDRIATAAGLTSGIDLALRVVERYLGQEAAAATARYMEHDSDAWRTAASA
jgi:transcriptional regulator GlxA family with amidase domain